MTLDGETLNGNPLVNGSNNEVSLKNSFRLVILGAPRVGKTCIINWFLGKEIKDSYLPTIEDFHRKIYKIKGEIYRLDILDTSGNDPFPAMKKLNIMTGDLFVLVFSIDDIDSYLQVKQLCELIVELKKTKQDQRNSNVPILILGNKLDYLLENKMNGRCIDSNETQQFASLFKSCIYSEVSCKKLMGLDSAFEKLFNSSNLPIEMIPSKHRRVSLNLDLTKPQFSRQIAGQPSDPIVINNQISNKNGQKITSDSNSYVTGNGNSSNSNSVHFAERDGSFKQTAKKSFRKMTFRKQITEACGTVWLNARRPSIRAELKLLQVKSNGKFTLHQTGLARNSSVKNCNPHSNTKRIDYIVKSFKNLFCCHMKTSLSRDSQSNFKIKKLY